MVQQIIYTDEQEDMKIMKYKEKWALSKAETIKKMIREFEQ